VIATEPPAPDQPAAAPIAALDRRTLLRGGLLGVGLLSAPLAAQAGGSGFTHGVASGEPRTDRVLLWTRYRAGEETRLDFEVSETPDFARTVSEGGGTAHPGHDWCCKTWANGLEPGRWYFYRFVAPDGTVSDTGRTRTLPEGPVDRFRMAVFSCSNIGFGWFNAYAHAAAANEFDLALHLGDYFYEYPLGSYPSDAQRIAGRWLEPGHEIVTLADYRLRYAAYRDDPDLRRVHQVMPMISGWDDHESTNDSWKGGAQNHQPETEGRWDARKYFAMRAYREWMPVSDEPWAAYEIGDLATLFRLETRLEARAEQFGIADLIAGKDSAEAVAQALTAFRDGAYRDPARELLGAEQQSWLADGLRKSKAGGKTWQVLVQQVLMGKTAAAAALTEDLPSDLPDYVRRRLTSAALASRAGLPFNMDAWDGYPAARERVFKAALEADANLVSLAGDTHNAWAFDLMQDEANVGVEFGGHSVTSPGIETALPQLDTGRFERATVEHNPELKWMDASQRGYMAVELTPERATSEYRFLSGVRERGAGVVASRRVTTLAGSNRLDIG